MERKTFNNSKEKQMKKLLMLLAVVALFASCSKDSSVASEQQKGRKVKTEALTVSLLTTFPAGEDAIVSIDSANWVTESVGTGNNVYWSVRGDETLLPSYAGVSVQVWIEANWADKWGVTSPTSHWTTVGQDWYLTYAPGKAGAIFDGYPGQTETRIYRAQLIDKSGIAHYSSAYQVN